MAEALRQAEADVAAQTSAASQQAQQQQEAAVQVQSPAAQQQRGMQQHEAVATTSGRAAPSSSAASSGISSSLGIYLGAAAVAGGLLFLAFRQSITSGAKGAAAAGGAALASGLAAKKLQREFQAQLNQYRCGWGSNGRLLVCRCGSVYLRMCAGVNACMRGLFGVMWQVASMALKEHGYCAAGSTWRHTLPLRLHPGSCAQCHAPKPGVRRPVCQKPGR